MLKHPWVLLVVVSSLSYLALLSYHQFRHRKKQFEQLQHFYDQLFQHASMLLLYHGSLGKIQNVNEAAMRFLGYTRTELFNLYVDQLFCFPDARAFSQYEEKVSSGKIHRGHVCIRDARGHPRILKFTSTPMGADAGIQVTASDVTDLWQLVCTRRALLRQSEFVLHAIPDLAVRVDAAGRILYINHDAPGLFKEDYLGKNVRSLFSGSTLIDRMANLSHALRTHTVVDGSFELDGHHFTSRVIPLQHPSPEALIILSDDTERLRQQRELLDNYQRFHALSHTIPGVLYRVDLNHGPFGKVVYLTEQIGSLTGYAAADFLSGKVGWFTLVVDEDLPELEKIFTSSPADGPFSIEYRIRCKQGKIRWVLNKGYTTYVGGKPTWRDGVILEITDLKRKEEEIATLNQTLEEFRYAINAASIVSITNTAGVITYVNKKFCAISGYTEAELLGKRHNIVNSGLHPRSFWKSMWATIGHGQVWRGEVRNKNKAGDYYWVDTFIVPIKDVTGEVIEYLSIRNEITEKKAQEDQLKLLSMVASQTSNFVLITDAIGKLEWVNASFENFTGYTLAEVKGRRPGSFLQGPGTDEEIKQYMSRKIKRHESFTCEILNYTKRGEPYWVQVNAQPIYGLTGSVEKYFAIMRNITAHKQLVQDLELTVQRAEEADRLKSLFLANISHEIRTPMNAIVGFSELLERSNLSPEKRHEFLRLIRERSYDLLQVVNDILDISRIEAGQISLVEQWGNVGELLERLMANFRAEATHLHHKPIKLELTTELAGDENIIHADFIRLNQVLVNLLSNATKFTERGTIKLRCHWRGKDTLMFVVADTGIGIAKEKQEVIFKPFRQADDTVHQAFGGSGLGLAICKGLVSLWGGRIWVDSSPGRGATFYFTLPYKGQVQD